MILLPLLALISLHKSLTITGEYLPDQDSIELDFVNRSTDQFGFVNNPLYFHVTAYDLDDKDVLYSPDQPRDDRDFLPTWPVYRVVLWPKDEMKIHLYCKVRLDYRSLVRRISITYRDAPIRTSLDSYTKDDTTTAFPFEWIKPVKDFELILKPSHGGHVVGSISQST
jgi:hypothetical protein